MFYADTDAWMNQGRTVLPVQYVVKQKYKQPGSRVRTPAAALTNSRDKYLVV